MTPIHTAYEIRCDGHLDRHWAGWLGDGNVRHNDDGTSSLVVHVTDQSALHGLLAKIRDLGIVIISITPVTTSRSFFGE